MPRVYPRRTVLAELGVAAGAGVFAALDDIRFKGWAIVELDRVPVPGRTPKESAAIARDYSERELKLTI